MRGRVVVWSAAQVAALALTLGLTSCASGSGGAAPVVPRTLVERASAEGAVRVIVGFRLPPGGAGDLQAIVVAREGILRQIAGTRHRVVRTYDTIPFVALEASPETLQVLATSPDVSSVEEDALARPQ